MPESLSQQIEQALQAFAATMWGMPLVVLIVGGGLFFLIHSRLLPYRHFGHALRVLRGEFDSHRDPGLVPHFHALSTALSGTLGLGNIAGVAVAITMGGPGAIFWMWVTAVVGVATKFYTASLAILYRGRDSAGVLQGGPMYVVREGLGKRWMPLAVLFAVAGLIGTTPVFQVNQLVQMLRVSIAIPSGWASPEEHFLFDIGAGMVIALLVLSVIRGDVQRVAKFAARLVPAMVLFYLGMTIVLLAGHLELVLPALQLIVTDAFTGEAVAGGAVGALILTGVRRGAFSNEAGIGTESLAHGAARTNEPIREGLVAMMGPVVDTLVVCTCTALAILVTGAWQQQGLDGVSMTARAFETGMPGVGQPMLLVMVVGLSLSTVVCFWYYGSKCLGFLIGAHRQHHYVWIYCALVVLGAVASLDMVIGLIDGMYAVMAIPTMTSALLLAPKVREAARDYLARHP